MTLVRFAAKNHPQQSHRPEVDDRTLPREDFEILERRFRFTVDVAASESNARLPRWFSVADCGLSQSWRGERVYCNPPYSDIRPWVEKAHREPADLVVMLLPANRTEQGWWQTLVEPLRDRAGSRLRVEFLSRRLRFIAPGRESIGPNERPPFGSCLLIWSDEPVPLGLIGALGLTAPEPAA